MRRSVTHEYQACIAFAAMLLAAVALAWPASAGAQTSAAPEADARVAAASSVQAKRLVRAVGGASNERQRASAILKVMRSLRIAVVTRTGRPLSAGPELRSARYFHFYDFELDAMAGQMERGETSSLTDVADMLTRGGLEIGEDVPFPPELLRVSIRDAVREAKRKPRSRRSLLPLLVRQLGLRNGYDLAKNVPLERVKLDPLQSALVMTDIVVPVLRKIPPSNDLLAREASAGSGARAAGVTDACAALNEKFEQIEKAIGKAANKALGEILDQIGEKLGRKATRWGIKNLPRWVVRGAWKAGKALNLGKQALGIVHASLLAFSIDVRALDELVTTHYLHEDGQDRKLVFQIQVVSKDDYGETLAQCGKLAGVELPRSGPVEGVPILWEQAVGELVPQHGRVDCQFPCTSQTGADGIARLTFTPHPEIVPGIGIEVIDTGVVNGLAAYQTKFDDANLVGLVSQILTPKYAGVRWEVAYHPDTVVLDFQGRFTHETEIEPTTVEVRASGMEFKRGESGQLSGERGLELLYYNKADWECWTHTWNVSPTDPMRVSSLTVNGDTRTADMTFHPGALSENVTHICRDDGSTYDEQHSLYTDAMQAFFPDGRIPAWEWGGGGDTVARFQFSGTRGEYSGHGEFRLRRVPAPRP